MSHEKGRILILWHTPTLSEPLPAMPYTYMLRAKEGVCVGIGASTDFSRQLVPISQFTYDEAKKMGGVGGKQVQC